MVAATAVLVVALTFQGTPRDTRTPQTDETVSVTKGARLVVDNFAGEVAIRTWDRDSLRVQARHSAKAKVNIRPTPTTVSVRSSSGAVGSVDYEITAPAWMPIRVQGTFNFITIEGAQSEVYAETTRGEIAIKGGTGSITAKAIQGIVTVEGTRGRLNVSSLNDRIRITDATGDITAESNNGDISVTQVKAANVEIATINGDILYDGPPVDRGRYRFTTHNGSITAVVPETANVSFIVRTYNGSFTSALKLNGPAASEVRQGRRNTYTLGNGSAEMEMESFGGSIRVRRPGSTIAPSPGKKEKDR